MRKTSSPRAKTQNATASQAPVPWASGNGDEPVQVNESTAFNSESLKRVQDIIKNARATWFTLLGALAFASITLASVKDIAFFVENIETKLPIVGISVPIVTFFWAGTLLIAALYAYFHLSLELLWKALGEFALKDTSGVQLVDCVEPWILSDAALRLREVAHLYSEERTILRTPALQLVKDVIIFGLVSLFGLLTLLWFWWRSMPAHDLFLTGFIGTVGLISIWFFLRQLTVALEE